MGMKGVVQVEVKTRHLHMEYLCEAISTCMEINNIENIKQFSEAFGFNASVVRGWFKGTLISLDNLHKLKDEGIVSDFDMTMIHDCLKAGLHSMRRKVTSKDIYRLHKKYEKGLSLEQCIKFYGADLILDRKTLHHYFQRLGLPTRKQTRKEFKMYKGDKYTICKDGFYRKTSGDRKHLHRRIWEENNGPVPRGYSVIFKEGNGLDFTKYDINNFYLKHQNEVLKDTRNNNQFTRNRQAPVIKQIFCKNCGKELVYKAPPSYHNKRVFCDMKCKREYDVKKRQG